MSSEWQRDHDWDTGASGCSVRTSATGPVGSTDPGSPGMLGHPGSLPSCVVGPMPWAPLPAVPLPPSWTLLTPGPQAPHRIPGGQLACVVHDLLLGFFGPI